MVKKIFLLLYLLCSNVFLLAQRGFGRIGREDYMDEPPTGEIVKHGPGWFIYMGILLAFSIYASIWMNKQDKK